MAKLITKLSEIKLGDFIKYSDRDKSGAFNYVGEVIKIDETNEIFEMLTKSGEMGFSFAETKESTYVSPFNNTSKHNTQPDESHQKLELMATKPKGWAKFKKNPAKFLAEEEKANTVAPVKTKKQQVFELVGNNPRKRLAGLLTLAKKEIGGNPATLKAQIQLALTRRK